jgi:hypothetical protein
MPFSVWKDQVVGNHLRVLHEEEVEKGITFTEFLARMKEYEHKPQADLLRAVDKGNAQDIKNAVLSGADPNETAANPLLFAWDVGNLDLFKFLMENGADPYVEQPGKGSVIDKVITENWSTFNEEQKLEIKKLLQNFFNKKFQ